MPIDPAPVPSPGPAPGEGTAGLAELLRRASRGDEAAFADLYDRTSTKVYGLARRVVRDPAQAEEVAQETYLAVWRQAARYDSAQGGPLAWILTIAHRRAVDRVRSAESARERDLRFAALGDGSDYDMVAETVTTSLEAARVRRALASLTEVQREAVLLAYYGGYTYKEVCELLDMPLGTIKTRVRDGRIRLRDARGVER